MLMALNSAGPKLATVCTSLRISPVGYRPEAGLLRGIPGLWYRSVNPSKLMLVWGHVILPFMAVLALGAMENHERRQLSGWLVNLGWDVCVLALGAAPAVFVSEVGAKLCGGMMQAAFWGFAYVLGTIFIAAKAVGPLRAQQDKRVRHGFVALGIGGSLLGALLFVATWSPTSGTLPGADGKHNQASIRVESVLR